MLGSIPIFLFSKDSSLTHIYQQQRKTSVWATQLHSSVGLLKIHQEMGYGQNGHDLRHDCTLKREECIFVHNRLLNTGITTYLYVMVCRGGQLTWRWSNCCHIFSQQLKHGNENLFATVGVRLCPCLCVLTEVDGSGDAHANTHTLLPFTWKKIRRSFVPDYQLSPHRIWLSKLVTSRSA